MRRALLRGSALVAAAWLSGAADQALGQPAATYSFDMPAEPLSKALHDYAQISGRQIIFTQADVAAKTAPALKGRYSPDEALSRLLAGSDLVADRSPTGGVLVRPKNGRAPATAQTADAGAAQPIATRSPTAPPASGTGMLAGGVLDPATGEFLRNATIHVVTSDGARHTTASGDGGQFRLIDLPAGQAQVTVSYTGFPDRTATVNITPGGTSRLEIQMGAQGQRAAHDDSTTVSGVLVVASRDGDARAIMSQRQSMDIKDSLSAESYGDIADGNPGEFIKFMPGVDTDADGDGDGTVRNIKLRGLPADYTGVTLNGLSLAGVDVMGGADGGRVFSFEQMSLSSIDSIEISKTISADVDANAPAGTVNIKTKRAFDRKGRRIQLQLSGSTHKDLWDSEGRTGPGEGGYGGKKFLPNWEAEYSDVFLNRRLGVLFGISQSNLYLEHEQTTLGRDMKPTALSPEPLAISSIETQLDVREISRLSATFNVDFKATDKLVLSLVSIYNRSGIWAGSTAYKFTTNARSKGVIGDPVFDITTNSGSMSIQNSLNYKQGEGVTVAPSFTYDSGRLTIDGNLLYSSSVSTYDPQGEKDSAYVLSALSATGNFRAQREPGDLYGQKWQIQQISGGDWSQPGSFALPKTLVLRLNNGPYAKLENTGGALNLTYRVEAGRIPVSLKAGYKNQKSEWRYEDRTDQDRYSYTGPLKGPELFGLVQSSNQISFADSGITIRSLNGSQDLFMPSNYKLLALYREHPEYWTQTSASSGTEWYGIFVGNNRRFSEETNALYAMATAELTDQLKVRAGLRWERTNTTAFEVDALSAAEVGAAGYPLDPKTHEPSTIPGLQYQYLSRPMIERKGEYDNFFPSASLKYSLTENTDLQIGYSRTIRRPPVGSLTGIWSIDDLNKIIKAPNPSLEPEISDNVSFRLVHYFEPVGMVAINYYRNSIKGLFQTQDLTAEEFGYTGADYADYTFRTTTRVSGDAINISGWEFEFNHALRYLPKPLNGLSVRGSFMVNNPEIPIVGVADKIGTLSLSYRKGPARLALNSVWTAEKYRSTTPSYYDDFWDVSLSGAYAFNKRVEGFFSIRNLLNSSRNAIVSGSTVPGGAVGDYSAVYLNAGVSGTAGLRLRF